MNGPPDIEHIRGNAWSFPFSEPPQGAELIATEERNGEKYYYYTNPDPEDAQDRPYLYDTESSWRFKVKMEAAIKKNKENERKKRCDV